MRGTVRNSVKWACRAVLWGTICVYRCYRTILKRNSGKSYQTGAGWGGARAVSMVIILRAYREDATDQTLYLSHRWSREQPKRSPRTARGAAPSSSAEGALPSRPKDQRSKIRSCNIKYQRSVPSVDFFGLVFFYFNGLLALTIDSILYFWHTRCPPHLLNSPYLQVKKPENCWRYCYVKTARLPLKNVR